MVDLFGAMMQGTINMSNSRMHGASEFACLAEPADEAACCARTFIDFLQIGVGRCIIRESLGAAAFGGPTWIPFEGSKGAANDAAMNFVVSSSALCLVHLEHSW